MLMSYWFEKGDFDPSLLWMSHWSDALMVQLAGVDCICRL